MCPQCETEYALDATQLAPSGTPVQCSACEHTFNAFPDGRTASPAADIGDEPTAVMPAADGDGAAPAQKAPAPTPTGAQDDAGAPDEANSSEAAGSTESARRAGKARGPKAGMSSAGDLRVKGGKTGKNPSGVVPPPPPLKGGGGRLFLAQGERIYKVKDIATLQRWVVEKRVLPNDRLSRDGKSWDVVSSVAELRPFFTVLDQLKQTKRALSKARKTSDSKKVSRSSSPAAPIPLRRDLPPPVLPSDRPAQVPLGSESLKAQERAVVELEDNVSVGATTPVGMADVSQAARKSESIGVEPGPAVTPPEPSTPIASNEVPAEAELPAGAEAPAAEDLPGASAAPESPVVDPADAERAASAADEATPGVPDHDDALADSFFGAVSDTIDDADDAIPGPFDLRATRPIPAPGARADADKSTRSFKVPGTVESSDALPVPESLYVPVETPKSDFDPDQTFDGMPVVRREKPGAGGSFYAFLVLLLLVALVAGWYFFVGPGRDKVFGDPLAGVTPPPSGDPVTSAVADPEQPGDEDEPDAVVDGQPASDGQTDSADPGAEASTPEPTPAKAEPTPAPEPTPKPAAVKKPDPTPAPPPAPKSAAALVKEGNRARDRGDYRGASSAYASALELKPSDVTTHIEMGWSLIELGRNSDAVTHFKRATSLSPGRPEGHYGLGLAYQTMGKNSQAVAAYKKVIELDPNGRDTREVQALLRQLE